MKWYYLLFSVLARMRRIQAPEGTVHNLAFSKFESLTVTRALTMSMMRCLFVVFFLERVYRYGTYMQ